jgi:polyisoprenoid-binding protein YceI
LKLRHKRGRDAVPVVPHSPFQTSTVSITIDATSIDTRVERRDKHLKSADFFDVAKHRVITFTFTSTAVRPKAAGQLDIYDSKVNPIKDDVTVQWDFTVQDPAATT